MNKKRKAMLQYCHPYYSPSPNQNRMIHSCSRVYNSMSREQMKNSIFHHCISGKHSKLGAQIEYSCIYSCFRYLIYFNQVYRNKKHRLANLHIFYSFCALVACTLRLESVYMEPFLSTLPNGQSNLKYTQDFFPLTG